MRSIRTTLLVWLSVGLSAAIIGGCLLVYLQANEEAGEIFDYQMRQIAASIPSHGLVPRPGTEPEDSGIEEEVVIQIRDPAGRIVYRSRHRALPVTPPERFTDVTLGGRPWRIFATREPQGAIIQVAQPLSARQEIAAQTALRTIVPMLLVFPVLAVLIWLAVGRSLEKVKRVAREVGSRGAGSLAPLGDEGLPDEIRPLTRAFNDLLERLSQLIDAQRHFIADAAHELRTPLTALNMQIEIAETASGRRERGEALADLKKGVARAGRLVEQLLTLARYEPRAFEQTLKEVDLAGLARGVVADLAAQANARGVDLGVEGSEAAPVTGNADALRILLGNLVDNAVRHTPKGGRVDVVVEPGALTVADTGPGIPEGELQHVFDRFYRGVGNGTHGSGLGLAIVKRIADLHQASVELANAPRGLRARVRFPV